MRTLLISLALVICLACAFAGVLEWLHIAYRVLLFAVQDHFALNHNHMAEETFTTCYQIALASALAASCALLCIRRLPALLHYALLAALLLNLLSFSALFTMRITGVLVEYGEAHNARLTPENGTGKWHRVPFSTIPRTVFSVVTGCRTRGWHRK